jgi:hypothetical protein
MAQKCGLDPDSDPDLTKEANLTAHTVPTIFLL